MMKNELKYAAYGAAFGPVLFPLAAYGWAQLAGNYFPKVDHVKDPSKKHIACVGDSITYGNGVILNRLTERYSAVLQTLVGKDWEVLNYGYSARTLQDEGDYPYTKEKMYKSSLDCNADIYTIMLGTNDTKKWNWDAARYEAELEEFAKKYIAIAGADHVFLMRPIHSFKVLGFNTYGIRDEQISEVCQIMDRVAAKVGCKTIDLNTLSEGHKEWCADGVHPGTEGNAIMAQAVYDGIKHLL